MERSFGLGLRMTRRGGRRKLSKIGAAAFFVKRLRLPDGHQ
jgi:hypothetical protein